MRASDVYALHVEEERYHQACEYLERARHALPTGSRIRSQIDAACGLAVREWRIARAAVARLHGLGPDCGGDEHHPFCILGPVSVACNREPCGPAPTCLAAPGDAVAVTEQSQALD
jgi:hypothetical protein